MFEKIEEEILNTDDGADFDKNAILELDLVLGSDATPLLDLNSTDIANSTIIIDQSEGTFIDQDNRKLVIMNVILRSVLGDLLYVIMDLLDRIIGSNRELLRSGDGLAITVLLRGKKHGSQNENKYSGSDNGRTPYDRMTNGRTNYNNNNNNNNGRNSSNVNYNI